jgi:hypothetical protein
MNRDDLTFWLTAVSTACWLVCFWWMYRIASRQDALICKLQEQTDRTEELSRVEHDLIQDVHPKVGEIKEAVEKVATDVHNGATQ